MSTGPRSFVVGGLSGAAANVDGGSVAAGAIAGGLEGLVGKSVNLGTTTAASNARAVAAGARSGGVGAVASLLAGVGVDALNSTFGDCGCGNSK
jgi:hypothetical protein